MSNVLFEVRDRVARVTLNRPASMNAVDGETEQELQRIWAAIEADRELRVVVLTGAGDRAFCAGSDMKNSDHKTGLEYWAAPRPDGFGGIALRQTLDVPVLARVNGFALGGGFEMVLGCDIVVACDDATFGLPEARVGRLPLDGVHRRLWTLLRHRQRDGAGTGAEVHDDGRPLAGDRGEPPVHEQLGLRPRHEHPGPHRQQQVTERRGTRKVL